MTHVEKATDLYQLINTGQLLDAFEKYYHEDVVLEEIGETPREGKAVNREYEKNFLASVKEFHGAGVLAITANEPDNKTMVESWMDLTFQNDFRVKMQQVAVQTWDGNQIIHETFYHK